MKAETITIPREDRISLKEKIGYSFGDAASNLYWKTFEWYLMFFYTDVFGISAAAVGTMLMVTRLADAVADPVMGSIADRTQTRWGHFRPYVLWGALPLAVAGVFTFTTPHLSGGGKVIYAYITYSLLMFIYTAVNIPYSALMGVISPNSLERTSISSIRFIGAFTAGTFIQYFTLKFVNWFGQGNEARGWQLTMVFYGILAIILLVLCFLTTHERVTPPAAQKSDLGRDMQNLFTSIPWIMLVGVLLLVLAAFAVKGSASTYYFKYYLHRESLSGRLHGGERLCIHRRGYAGDATDKNIRQKAALYLRHRRRRPGDWRLLPARQHRYHDDLRAADHLQLHYRLQLAAGLGHVCGYCRPRRMAHRPPQYRTVFCLGHLRHQDRICRRRMDIWPASHVFRL